jgi:arsenate reductase
VSRAGVIAETSTCWLGSLSSLEKMLRGGRRESRQYSDIHGWNRVVKVSSSQRRPVVLFVCVHNAGRSQMAAGWVEYLAGGRVDVMSGGSQPATSVNNAAVLAMAEVGIDIASASPRAFTASNVQEADIVITMGCGDTCPIFPGKRYEDWVLDDPAGLGVDAVRPIRDEIRRRVVELLNDLGVETT